MVLDIKGNQKFYLSFFLVLFQVQIRYTASRNIGKEYKSKKRLAIPLFLYNRTGMVSLFRAEKDERRRNSHKSAIVPSDFHSFWTIKHSRMSIYIGNAFLYERIDLPLPYENYTVALLTSYNVVQCTYNVFLCTPVAR